MKSALAQTADTLRASIAAREATLNQTADFRAVTESEKARLKEVEAALASEKPAVQKPA